MSGNKVAIMQPYFLPYIGYWQLINSVDKFILYDDVNYKKKGWINRNNFLINNNIKIISLELVGISQNKLIKEINLSEDNKWKKKMLKSIELSYKRAPYYKEIYEIFKKIILNDEKNLALFLKDSISIIMSYIGIETKLILSSDIKKDINLKGQDKIIDICKKNEVQNYYNLIGGMDLYDKKSFKNKDINLFFIKSEIIEYTQFGEDFKSNLSILDLLMFNSKAEVKKKLKMYTII